MSDQLRELASWLNETFTLSKVDVIEIMNKVTLLLDEVSDARQPQKFNLQTLEGRKAAWEWLNQHLQAEGIKQFKAATQMSNKPRVGNHDCEYDSESEDATCKHCGLTSGEAVKYLERRINQPQEWRQEDCSVWQGDVFIGRANTAFQAKHFIDAHNAELATEREKYPTHCPNCGWPGTAEASRQ